METKKKTALQEAIDKIQEVLDFREANENNCDDFELGLIESIKVIKSLFPKEIEEINNAYDIGCVSGIRGLKIRYFTETFEQ
jgi:hypothetical protein